MFAGVPVLVQASDVPPTESVALFNWLEAGSYRTWSRETAPHKSQGPHPSQVITYLNAALDKSLSAKTTAHPKGSAAVKELLDATGRHSGWAVSVKT